MKLTIAEQIKKIASQYPGQLMSRDTLIKKVVDACGCEPSSVRKVLAKFSKSNDFGMKQLTSQDYQFQSVVATKKPRKRSPKMKGRTFVAIVRDHSGSMGPIAEAAMMDYNRTLENLQANSKLSKTTLTVIECGIHSRFGLSQVNVAEQNVPVEQAQPLRNYDTTGGTPLYDSIGEAINQLKQIYGVEPIDAFMVIVITDGQEAHSRRWSAMSLMGEIIRLQSTNQWTFAFRVPYGYRHHVSSLGVPPENIIEWEATSRGMEQSSIHTSMALDSYYAGRSQGKTQSVRFFADTSHLNTQVLKQNLVNISNELQLLQVRVSDPTVIRDFFKNRVGEYTAGCGFYQLVKNEKVQSYKQIIIRDKQSGAAYSGAAARQMLGFPATGDIKVAPGSFSQYDIYVQSTSVNRILPINSLVLYWKGAK